VKLLTKELRKKLPPLYATEHDPDPLVRVKFFTPDSSWTWYAIEGGPELDSNGVEVDYIFFGYVVGLEAELGYFSLRELESVKGPPGLKVERDLYFEPVPLSEIRGRHENKACSSYSSIRRYLARPKEVDSHGNGA